MARHSIASLVFCIGAYLKSTRCYALIIGVSFVFPAQAIHVYLGHAPGRLSRPKSKIRPVVDGRVTPARGAAPETPLIRGASWLAESALNTVQGRRGYEVLFRQNRFSQPVIAKYSV